MVTRMAPSGQECIFRFCYNGNKNNKKETWRWIQPHILSWASVWPDSLTSIPPSPGSPMLATAVLLGTVIGSQAPDFDGLLRVKSNALYVKNHRGITHSLPFLVIWTALISGILAMLFRSVLKQGISFSGPESPFAFTCSAICSIRTVRKPHARSRNAGYPGTLSIFSIRLFFRRMPRPFCCGARERCSPLPCSRDYTF